MDLPIKNGGSFHSYVNVYQRVNEVSPRIGFQLFYLWLGGAKHVFFVQGFGGVDPWLDQTELDWRSFNGSGYLNELNTKWFIMLTMLTMFIYVHRCSYIYIYFRYVHMNHIFSYMFMMFSLGSTHFSLSSSGRVPWFRQNRGVQGFAAAQEQIEWFCPEWFNHQHRV